MTLTAAVVIASALTQGVTAAALTTRCATNSCTSLTSCPPESAENLEALACFASLQDKSCEEAIDQARQNGKTSGIALRNSDDLWIRAFYREHASDATCPWPKPKAIQQAWLDASVLLGDPQPQLRGTLRYGLQLVPTVTVGIPLWVGEDGPANDALEDFPTSGGLLARFTPLGYLASVHAFASLGSVKSGDLPVDYTNPSMLLLGTGVDFFGGAVAFSYVHAQLKKTGPFKSTGDSVDYVQMGVDLTPLLVSLTGFRK